MRSIVAGLLVLACGGYASAKPKVVLPAYVLQAHTVYIMIDPDAGLSVRDPLANRTAQRDVEAAFLSWGRFSPVAGPQNADLIVVVRRGNARPVEQTITDPRQNNRPGTMTPGDSGVLIGGQRGRQAGQTDDSSASAPQQAGPQPGQQAGPQTEVGETADQLLVFRGDTRDPLNTAPIWRSVAKDGLRPHAVPAVDEFKRAITDAEKAAKKP